MKETTREKQLERALLTKLVWNSLQGQTSPCFLLVLLAPSFHPQIKRAPGLSVSTLWTRNGGVVLCKKTLTFGDKFWLHTNADLPADGDRAHVHIHIHTLMNSHRHKWTTSHDFSVNILLCLCTLYKIEITFTSKTNYKNVSDEAVWYSANSMGSLYDTKPWFES